MPPKSALIESSQSVIYNFLGLSVNWAISVAVKIIILIFFSPTFWVVNATLGVSDTLICVTCVAHQTCFYSIPTKAVIVVRLYMVFT
jgi:hypothetical protein